MLSDEGTVKLIDFGLAKQYGTPERQHTNNVTTRAYRAPEVLFLARHYGPAIDIWAAGCIFGELILREVLFPGTSDIDQLGKIFTLRGTPTVSKLSSYTPHLRLRAGQAFRSCRTTSNSTSKNLRVLEMPSRRQAGLVLTC